jgi:hypothetical protein
VWRNTGVSVVVSAGLAQPPVSAHIPASRLIPTISSACKRRRPFHEVYQGSYYTVQTQSRPNEQKTHGWKKGTEWIRFYCLHQYIFSTSSMNIYSHLRFWLCPTSNTSFKQSLILVNVDRCITYSIVGRAF